MVKLEFNVNDISGLLNIDDGKLTMFINVDNSVFMCDNVDNNLVDFCVDVLIRKDGIVVTKIMDTDFVLSMKISNEYVKTDFIDFKFTYYSSNTFLVNTNNTGYNKIVVTEWSDGIFLHNRERSVKISDAQIANITRPFSLTRKGMLKCLRQNMDSVVLGDSQVTLPTLYDNPVSFIIT